jgi:hypothetical protein
MKLSEIKGDRALEVIADIMEPISNLVSDPAVKKIFENRKKEPVIKKLPEVIKSHKPDIYKMLATLEGVNVEEYKKTTSLIKIIQDFTDMIMDESIQQLFISAKPVEEKN